MTSTQATIRQAGRAARASLDEQTHCEASSQIARHITSANWFRRAHYLGCYLPTSEEVDTREIIARAWRMKKRVFAPVCETGGRMQFREVLPGTDLCPNHYGVLEPVNGETMTARMLDVVITPVVAYDQLGHRVGMGGGYFDRTFSFLRHRSAWLHPKLVGVAFACQRAAEIRSNPWDIRLFSVVTERGKALRTR